MVPPRSAVAGLPVIVVVVVAAAALLGAQAQRLPIMAIAHRGSRYEFPENTMLAIDYAYRSGCDYVEIDVRTTKDGALILMHDGTVDRTTNGTGHTRTLTMDYVRTLDAGSWFDPQFAGEPVPTFRDALRFAKPRGLQYYIDTKDASEEALLADLRAEGMEAQVVVFRYHLFLTRLQALAPHVRVMPPSLTANALNTTLELLHPVVVQMDDNDFRPPVIEVALNADVGIFVNRFGEFDTPTSWQDAVIRGATGIHTNKPLELATWLRDSGYHPRKFSNI